MSIVLDRYPSATTLATQEGFEAHTPFQEDSPFAESDALLASLDRSINGWDAGSTSQVYAWHEREVERFDAEFADATARLGTDEQRQVPIYQPEDYELRAELPSPRQMHGGRLAGEFIKTVPTSDEILAGWDEKYGEDYDLRTMVNDRHDAYAQAALAAGELEPYRPQGLELFGFYTDAEERSHRVPRPRHWPGFMRATRQAVGRMADWVDDKRPLHSLYGFVCEVDLRFRNLTPRRKVAAVVLGAAVAAAAIGYVEGEIMASANHAIQDFGDRAMAHVSNS